MATKGVFDDVIRRHVLYLVVDGDGFGQGYVIVLSINLAKSPMWEEVANKRLC